MTDEQRVAKSVDNMDEEAIAALLEKAQARLAALKEQEA
jgi:hypothetical protein